MNRESDPDAAAPHAAHLARGALVRALCTVTDDGSACALEYNVVRWGDRMVAAQAGMAVYERATPTALRAARIYDDVELAAD